jgi:hypothetical protein
MGYSEYVRSLHSSVFGRRSPNLPSARIDEECLTPGQGIRSRGMGRGYATGYGRGPVGRPYNLGPSPEPNICKTPGMKIRSEGRGRGLARGRGRGPMGTPYGYK